MTRFAATAINLQDLEIPPIIQQYAFEDILALLKAELKLRWPAFNVEALESDPVVKVLQVMVYREIMLRAEFNDRARGVLLAYAHGGDLDHRAVYQGVTRFEGESDEAFRERVQLAPEAYSTAGPEGAYIFHARSASPDVLDASAVKFAEGQVQVFILPKPGVDVPDLLKLVRDRLALENVVPLTDNFSVLPATPIPFVVTAVLEMGLGPDPALIKQRATDAVQAYIAKRARIGLRVTTSGLINALMVGGVDKVRLISPAADIVPAAGGITAVSSVTITTEVVA